MSWLGRFKSFIFFLYRCQNRLTDSPHPSCQTSRHGPVQDDPHEIEALLRLLADMEREELELVMLERREAERVVATALTTGPARVAGFLFKTGRAKLEP